MTAHDQASVLRRKMRAAREGSDPRMMSPVKALRLSLARAADNLLGLALTVATVEQRRVDPTELEAALGCDGLFVLLDGTGGARGALRLDPALLAGLIEMQTIGKVLPGAVRARPATRTDAAMVAPLLDAMLAGYDAEMAAGQAQRVPGGFRFGDRVEDARALALLLPAPGLDHFRLTVDLGPGMRTGRLDLVVPSAAVRESARAAGARADRRAGAASAAGADMASVALSAPAVLDAVLARLNLPLRAALALRVGDRLDLPRDSLGRALLLGAGGHVVAEGRLGQREGWRALRLRIPLEDGEGAGQATPGEAAAARREATSAAEARSTRTDLVPSGG